MCVKGENAVHTHVFQLPQHHRAVQRFACRFPVLPAFVKEGHDDRDPLRLAVAGRDHAFQILIMVIRRHVVFDTVHLIFQRPVAYVHQDENIPVPYGFLEDALCLPARKARALRLNQAYFSAAPLRKDLIDTVARPLCRLQGNQRYFSGHTMGSSLFLI